MQTNNPQQQHIATTAGIKLNWLIF